jgi:SAM-dependent methyltransferase
MDKAYYLDYYKLERSNWWFTTRLKIIELELDKVIDSRSLNILNIGVATGATSDMLRKYGEVTSIEYDKETCTFLREHLQMDVINASITELPFPGDKFDLVCAFDVIEHVSDDVLAYQEMTRVCSKNGLVAVTVPAFMFLWSEHDIINHHFRRYRKGDIKNIVNKIGLSTKRSTYFNSILFVPICMARALSNIFKNKDKKLAKSDFRKFDFPILNNMLAKIFSIEKSLLSKFSLPFGVSYLEISKKTNDEK